MAEGRRNDFVFRPGEMPPMFGDTAAALIVDDDDLLARAMARLLTREGYHCTVAGRAADARDKLAQTEFAIALVDVMMPGESGLELVADMLAGHPDLAVVMVTGVDDPSIADLALQSGAYGYVVKPFRPNHVLITVANAGRRRCLEIERRVYQERLERRVEEQATLAPPAGSSPDRSPAGGTADASTTAAAGLEGLDDAGRGEALQRLAMRIAHDMNNVLAAISSYANLAMDSLPPGAEALADLDGILRGVQQGTTCTRELLEVANALGGEIDLGLSSSPVARPRAAG